MEGRALRMASLFILILLSTDFCIPFFIFSMGSAGLRSPQSRRRVPGVATNPFDSRIVTRGDLSDNILSSQCISVLLSVPPEAAHELDAQ